MRRMGFALALVLVAGLGWSSRALAQAEHYGNRPWELNAHAGAHWFDDDDDSPRLGLGTRIFINMPSGWGFGGSFDWIPADEQIDGLDLDFNVFLYSAEVEYTFASPGLLHPFVGAGIGAATFKLKDIPDEFDDSETELLIPLVAGIKWFHRTNSPNWAIRAELRDNIIDGDSHNWEISGGISFLFGG